MKLKSVRKAVTISVRNRSWREVQSRIRGGIYVSVFDNVQLHGFRIIYAQVIEHIAGSINET